MNLADFEKHVRERCTYETIYDDTEGRRLVVIRLLDMYALFNSLRADEAPSYSSPVAHMFGDKR